MTYISLTIMTDSNTEEIIDSIDNIEIDDKTRIINTFNTKIKGKPIILPQNSNSKNCGKEGHWLEEKFNIDRNCKNEPDIYGFELKKESKIITFGDFSASEYLFSKDRFVIKCYNDWFDVNIDYTITKDEFIKYFGEYNENKDRYSWSGKCIPKYNKVNYNGTFMEFTDSDDLCIYYSYSLDERKNIDLPEFMRKDNLLITIWYKEKLENCINKKFNNKGFIICKKKKSLNVYNKICFGSPFDYNVFKENIKNKNIYFDSGMYSGNNRNYSQFRSQQNDFWYNLIIEEY